LAPPPEGALLPVDFPLVVAPPVRGGTAEPESELGEDWGRQAEPLLEGEGRPICDPGAGWM